MSYSPTWIRVMMNAATLGPFSLNHTLGAQREL
jgi:hypothetical protein